MNGAYILCPLADTIGLTALRSTVAFHWPSILDRSVYTAYLFLLIHAQAYGLRRPS